MEKGGAERPSQSEKDPHKWKNVLKRPPHGEKEIV